MHEDELKTPGFGDEYEPILPDGYREGDDIFADPSTWSGNRTEQSDEAAEQEQEAGADNTEADVDDLLTTEEETEESPSAEPDEDTPAPGQEQEPEKSPRTLKLKVNHEDREVDVNDMTDDELTAMLQKSFAFDAMKDEQRKARYREVYEDQVDRGMTEETARLVAANACEGHTYSLEDPVEEETAPAQQTAPVRDLAAEVKQLRALYPDFKEMPNSVAKAVAEGAPLLSAFVAYREQETNKAAATLKRENSVLKQNAASAAKAPVTPVTRGGSTAQKKTNLLLGGWDEDENRYH